MQQYLYKTTGLSLGITYLIGLITINALLRLTLGIETTPAIRQTIAVGLGLLVVTTPIWWLHWCWICRQQTTATAAMRHDFRTYVLTTSIVALFVVFGSAGVGVAVLARLVLGLLMDSTLGWVQSLLAVMAMVSATAIWSLHWRYVVEGRTDWGVVGR